MLALFVELAVQNFQQFSKVTTGGLFILNGLIATVDNRIQPYVPNFIEYIVCAMKMENCDAMGTRVACGIISDLANSIGDGIIQWLPAIVAALQRILESNDFDSEVKLIAIIAFGDVCLAAGPHNYLQYLPET